MRYRGIRQYSWLWTGWSGRTGYFVDAQPPDGESLGISRFTVEHQGFHVRFLQLVVRRVDESSGILDDVTDSVQDGASGLNVLCREVNQFLLHKCIVINRSSVSVSGFLLERVILFSRRTSPILSSQRVIVCPVAAMLEQRGESMRRTFFIVQF